MRFKQWELTIFLLFEYHLHRHADGHRLGIDVDDLSAQSQTRLFVEFHGGEHIGYGQVLYKVRSPDGVEYVL